MKIFNKYKKLYRLLKEGRVCVVYVKTATYTNRCRIVTPNFCEYSYIDPSFDEVIFNPSCWLKETTPEGIVRSMIEFDSSRGYKLLSVEAL